jgi:hypothetical protein
VPTRGLHAIEPNGLDPEDGDRTFSGRRLKEVEGRERKTQPGGKQPHQRKPSYKDACRGSSSSSREDRDVHRPSRRSGGKGGTLRREGRNRIKAIRNPDSLDPNRLLREVGEGFGGHEGDCEPGHQSTEIARATGFGSVKLQGGSEPLQALISGKFQWTSDNGGLYSRGCDARIKDRPRTKGRTKGQESREEGLGRDHDFRVQGRIRIRGRRLSNTGSPPKTWNTCYKPRSGDCRVCHT